MSEQENKNKLDTSEKNGDNVGGQEKQNVSVSIEDFRNRIGELGIFQGGDKVNDHLDKISDEDKKYIDHDMLQALDKHKVDYSEGSSDHNKIKDYAYNSYEETRNTDEKYNWNRGEDRFRNEKGDAIINDLNNAIENKKNIEKMFNEIRDLVENDKEGEGMALYGEKNSVLKLLDDISKSVNAKNINDILENNKFSEGKDNIHRLKTEVIGRLKGMQVTHEEKNKAANDLWIEKGRGDQDTKKNFEDAAGKIEKRKAEDVKKYLRDVFNFQEVVEGKGESKNVSENKEVKNEEGKTKEDKNTNNEELIKDLIKMNELLERRRELVNNKASEEEISKINEEIKNLEEKIKNEEDKTEEIEVEEFQDLVNLFDKKIKLLKEGASSEEISKVNEGISRVIDELFNGQEKTDKKSSLSDILSEMNINESLIKNDSLNKIQNNIYEINKLIEEFYKDKSEKYKISSGEIRKLLDIKNEELSNSFKNPEAERVGNEISKIKNFIEKDIDKINDELPDGKKINKSEFFEKLDDMLIRVNKDYENEKTIQEQEEGESESSNIENNEKLEKLSQLFDALREDIMHLNLNFDKEYGKGYGDPRRVLDELEKKINEENIGDVYKKHSIDHGDKLTQLYYKAKNGLQAFNISDINKLEAAYFEKINKHGKDSIIEGDEKNKGIYLDGVDGFQKTRTEMVIQYLKDFFDIDGEDPGGNKNVEDPGGNKNVEDPGGNKNVEDPGENKNVEDPEGKDPEVLDNILEITSKSVEIGGIIDKFAERIAEKQYNKNVEGDNGFIRFFRRYTTKNGEIEKFKKQLKKDSGYLMKYFKGEITSVPEEFKDCQEDFDAFKNECEDFAIRVAEHNDISKRFEINDSEIIDLTQKFITDPNPTEAMENELKKKYHEYIVRESQSGVNSTSAFKSKESADNFINNIKRENDNYHLNEAIMNIAFNNGSTSDVETLKQEFRDRWMEDARIPQEITDKMTEAEKKDIANHIEAVMKSEVENLKLFGRLFEKSGRVFTDKGAFQIEKDEDGKDKLDQAGGFKKFMRKIGRFAEKHPKTATALLIAGGAISTASTAGIASLVALGGMATLSGTLSAGRKISQREKGLDINENQRTEGAHSASDRLKYYESKGGLKRRLRKTLKKEAEFYDKYFDEIELTSAKDLGDEMMEIAKKSDLDNNDKARLQELLKKAKGGLIFKEQTGHNMFRGESKESIEEDLHRLEKTVKYVESRGIALPSDFDANVYIDKYKSANKKFNTKVSKEAGKDFIFKASMYAGIGLGMQHLTGTGIFSPQESTEIIQGYNVNIKDWINNQGASVMDPAQQKAALEALSNENPWKALQIIKDSCPPGSEIQLINLEAKANLVDGLRTVLESKNLDPDLVKPDLINYLKSDSSSPDYFWDLMKDKYGLSNAGVADIKNEFLSSSGKYLQDMLSQYGVDNVSELAGKVNMDQLKTAVEYLAKDNINIPGAKEFLAGMKDKTLEEALATLQGQELQLQNEVVNALNKLTEKTFVDQAKALIDTDLMGNAVLPNETIVHQSIAGLDVSGPTAGIPVMPFIPNSEDYKDGEPNENEQEGIKAGEEGGEESSESNKDNISGSEENTNGDQNVETEEKKGVGGDSGKGTGEKYSNSNGRGSGELGEGNVVDEEELSGDGKGGDNMETGGEKNDKKNVEEPNNNVSNADSEKNFKKVDEKLNKKIAELKDSVNSLKNRKSKDGFTTKLKVIEDEIKNGKTNEAASHIEDLEKSIKQIKKHELIEERDELRSNMVKGAVEGKNSRENTDRLIELDYQIAALKVEQSATDSTVDVPTEGVSNNDQAGESLDINENQDLMKFIQNDDVKRLVDKGQYEQAVSQCERNIDAGDVNSALDEAIVLWLKGDKSKASEFAISAAREDMYPEGTDSNTRDEAIKRAKKVKEYFQKEESNTKVSISQSI